MDILYANPSGGNTTLYMCLPCPIGGIPSRPKIWTDQKIDSAKVITSEIVIWNVKAKNNYVYCIYDHKHPEQYHAYAFCLGKQCLQRLGESCRSVVGILCSFASNLSVALKNRGLELAVVSECTDTTICHCWRLRIYFFLGLWLREIMKGWPLGLWSAFAKAFVILQCWQRLCHVPNKQQSRSS